MDLQHIANVYTTSLVIKMQQALLQKEEKDCWKCT